jgi:hypothetical protein
MIPARPDNTHNRKTTSGPCPHQEAGPEVARQLNK